MKPGFRDKAKATFALNPISVGDRDGYPDLAVVAGTGVTILLMRPIGVDDPWTNEGQPVRGPRRQATRTGPVSRLARR
jgi:hypothetical protein